MRLGELVWPDNLELQDDAKLSLRHSVCLNDDCYIFLLPHDKADIVIETSFLLDFWLLVAHLGSQCFASSGVWSGSLLCIISCNVYRAPCCLQGAAFAPVNPAFSLAFHSGQLLL